MSQGVMWSVAAFDCVLDCECRSKACLLRGKVSVSIIHMIESWIRPHSLVSIKKNAKRNQVDMILQLRECVDAAACFWNEVDSSMFVYACLNIHNKYGWG